MTLVSRLSTAAAQGAFNPGRQKGPLILANMLLVQVSPRLRQRVRVGRSHSTEYTSRSGSGLRQRVGLDRSHNAE